MRRIRNYIPETTHVPRAHNFATTCGSHYMVQVCYIHCGMFSVCTLVLSTVFVHCPVRSCSVVSSCPAFKPRAVIFSKIMAKNHPLTAEVYTSTTMKGFSVENLARDQIYQKFSFTYRRKFH